jgi:protein O-mannosyl-transferase
MSQKSQRIKKEKVNNNKLQKNQPKDVAPTYSIWEKLLPPAVLSILTIIFYYPSLHNPFQFDDIAHITKKFHIRHYQSWRWSHVLSPRWFADWLNKVNYKIGKFDPFSYRVVDLIIHILAGVVLFYLILTICTHIKKSKFVRNNALLISSLTTALFLLHPVQTQLVSYVIQSRLEGLATLFILTTLLFFVKIVQSKNIISKIIFTILMAAFALLSSSTKEIVVVVPFLAIALDWFLLSEQSWKTFKNRFWIYIIFAITIFGSFIYFKSWAWIKKIFSFNSAVLNNRGNILTKKHTDLITPGTYFISEFKVILHYLLIFIWPINMSVEYDWKLVDGFFAPDAFFPFLILSAIVIFIIRNIVKKQYPFLTFGLVWFLIAIAPRSSIIPSAELICDYKTYLSSVGWLFAIAIGITHIINYIADFFKNHDLKSIFNKSFIAIFSLIIIFYTTIASILIWKMPQSMQAFGVFFFLVPATFAYFLYFMIKNQKQPQLYAQTNKILFSIMFLLPIGYGALERNKVFETNEAYWDDIVKKAPLKARGHNNLGVAKAEAHKWDEAIRCYKEAIRLDSIAYPDPWSNLAVAYSTKNQIDMAIMALKKAIQIFPHYPEAYNNLGAFYLQKKDLAGAEHCFNLALKLRPYYGKAFMNLGRLYLEKKENDKAYESFVKATKGDLDNEMGFRALGEACIKIQKFPEAIEAFNKAISMGARQTQTYFNLANAYFMTGGYQNAAKIYGQLAQSDQKNPLYLYNLGETLFRLGNTMGALEAFNKSKSLPNSLAQTHFRIVNCLEKLGKLADAKKYLNSIINIKNAPEWFATTAQNELKRIETLSNQPTLQTKKA